jgi:hypothetical protein
VFLYPIFRGIEIKVIYQIMHASHLEILEWKDGVIPLVSLVTLDIYVAIHGGATLTPSLAFTVFALFGIFIQVYAIAPQGMILSRS